MADFTDVVVIDLGLAVLPAADPEPSLANYVRLDLPPPAPPPVAPTVTWITPPSSSIGTTSPVVFSISGTGAVSAISVKFPTGPQIEERAYRSGTFLYPYDQSTQTLTEFTLRRRNGWPFDFIVYVDTTVTP